MSQETFGGLLPIQELLLLQSMSSWVLRTHVRLVPLNLGVSNGTNGVTSASSRKTRPCIHHCCVMGEEGLTGLHLFYRQKTKGFRDVPKTEGWVSDSSFLGELSPGTAYSIVLILHWTLQSLTLILLIFHPPQLPLSPVTAWMLQSWSWRKKEGCFARERGGFPVTFPLKVKISRNRLLKLTWLKSV